jgi:hypothetical protein
LPVIISPNCFFILSSTLHSIDTDSNVTYLTTHRFPKRSLHLVTMNQDSLWLSTTCGTRRGHFRSITLTAPGEEYKLWSL